MPIYEYRCDKCDREFEVERRITDPPLASCPKCRSRKLRRLISQTSFVLKGGGWYSDLYSSKSSPKSDADRGGSKEAGDAKDSKDSTSPTRPDSTPSKGGEGPGGSGGKKGKGKKSECKCAA